VLDSTGTSISTEWRGVSLRTEGGGANRGAARSRGLRPGCAIDGGIAAASRVPGAWALASVLAPRANGLSVVVVNAGRARFAAWPQGPWRAVCRSALLTRQAGRPCERG